VAGDLRLHGAPLPGKVLRYILNDGQPAGLPTVRPMRPSNRLASTDPPAFPSRRDHATLGARSAGEAGGMIAAVTGRLVGRLGDSLLLDVGPLVLRVHTSASTLADAGEPGAPLRLHTHLYVREDQLALYGFLTSEELALFQRLLGVGGIGPRVAATILGATRPEPFLDALAREDLVFLGRLPGVGKKTAARLVLDLRGTLPDLGGDAVGALPAPGDGEVVEALQALGYTAAEARAAVERLPRDADSSVEARIVAALQTMSEA
jgi:Holliday junction DNA helicase RuvA